MLHVVKKLYHDSRIRYLFFGGCTTLVNLGLFAVLKGPLGIDYRISNFFSVAAAICFAFVVNKLFVFQSRTTSFTEGFREFIRFVLGRLVTMAVEVGGVPILRRNSPPAGNDCKTGNSGNCHRCQLLYQQVPGFQINRRKSVTV